MKHLERAYDGQNQWWKYVLTGLIGFLGANLVGSIPLIIVMFVKASQSGKGMADIDINNLQSVGISSNLGLFLMLLPFAIGLVTVALLFRAFHKRTFNEVVNGTKRFRWHRYFFAFIVWGGLLTAVFGIDYLSNPSNFTFNFQASKFIPLLFIALTMLPLQTAFEEILFRGYFLQGIATGTKNRWAAILITGISFGLIHIFNPEIKAYGILFTLPQYILFGVFFGMIAVLDDGIELTLGAHAVNNMFACLVVTFKSSALSTDALFTQHKMYPQRDLIVFTTVSLLFMFILSRKYKWNFAVFQQPVEKPVKVTIPDITAQDDQMRNA